MVFHQTLIQEISKQILNSMHFQYFQRVIGKIKLPY